MNNISKRRHIPNYNPIITFFQIIGRDFVGNCFIVLNKPFEPLEII